MLNSKLFLVATAAAAIAVPAGAQVAGVNANVGVQANTGAATDTVTQTVDTATDAAANAAAQAAAQANVEATVEPGPIVPATAADITAGAKVYGPKNGLVGTIEEVNAGGAIVATGKSRVQLPLASFAKNNLGLVISVSKDQLDAQAAAAASASAGAGAQ